MGRLSTIIFAAALAFIALPSTADDRLDDGVLTVCAEGCEFTSINEAIALIPESGGINDHYVEIHDAVHREGVEIRSGGRNFTIRAGDSVKGVQYPVIDGQSTHRILRVESGSQVGLLGIAFENGMGSTNGGAILVVGSSYLSSANCEFRGNSGDPTVTASRGGAVYVNNNNAGCIFTRCLFDSNVAARGGAVNANAFDSIIVMKSEFRGNDSTDPSYADSIVNGDGDGVFLEETTFCGEGAQISGSFDFSVDSAVTIADSCDASSAVPGDYDGDGDLDVDDLTAIREALAICVADIDGDGDVDGSDLAYVLGFWGACSAP